jgi:MtN3 and saliva related transmembrane protein
VAEMKNTNQNLVSLYEKYMMAVGILGQAVFFLQAFTIWSEKSARDVSFWGFLSGFISVASWMCYGLLKNDRPLIIANVVALVGASLVLIGICAYG